MKIKIGIIGDFDGRPSHFATQEALGHSGRSLGLSVESAWLPTSLFYEAGRLAEYQPLDTSKIDTAEIKTAAQLELASTGENILNEFSGVFCAPGTPYRSFLGAITAIRFAREKGLAFLGTCGGFQYSILEYAVHVLGQKGLSHPDDQLSPGVDLKDSWITPLQCSLIDVDSRIHFQPGSRVQQIMGVDHTSEKFRCQYGLSQEARRLLESEKLQVVGVDDRNDVVVVELKGHPFFILTLFQPQLSSTMQTPHPLISAFLSEALKFAEVPKTKNFESPRNKEFLI